MKISKEEARSFLVQYQNLTASQSLSGIEGVLEYIKKVGCIQYDPLNIIGRNADLVLQSKIEDYRPQVLEQLIYKDRLLIDGWDKMMSIYSSEDWAYFHRVREYKGAEIINTLEYRNSSEALLYIDTIMESIAENGPMQPKQIQLGTANAGRWGHRILSSATMDYLFHIGKLGVHKKINVNKVYDLIENILSEEILTRTNPFKTEYDFIKWYVYRRLGSVDLLWNKDGGAWLAAFLGDKKLRQRILDEYVADGIVKCIEVEGISDKFYIRSKDEYLLNTSSFDESKAMRFIAPLDNLLWDRSMLSKLFDFNYTWEVYVPVAKRKYGYYVIPVLYGNRFIARFEPLKSKTHMQIKNWWWEDGVSVSSDMVELSLREMERFAKCFGKQEGVHESVYASIKKNGKTTFFYGKDSDLS